MLNGLRLREDAGHGAGGVRRWSITGENPDFWWDIVMTRLDAGSGAVELHCTRCGHRDQAPSAGDVLGLIRAGAHCHDIDPAGGS